MCLPALQPLGLEQALPIVGILFFFFFNKYILFYFSACPHPVGIQLMSVGIMFAYLSGLQNSRQLLKKLFIFLIKF